MLAFGIARDILKASTASMDIENGLTIGDLRRQITRDHPEFDLLASLRFAVNEAYVSDSHLLSDGDEVVLIPPVSGG